MIRRRIALPSRTSRRAVPIELMLALIIGVVAAGNALRQRPYTFPAPPDAEQPAPRPAEVVGSDVLVVVPSVREATSLSTMTFDAAWLSTVEQEVGHARTAPAAQLSRSHLDAAAWVVVPRTAASQLDPAQVQFLRNWVQDGGVALVEQPEGPWESIAGQVFGVSRLRESRRITSFDGGPTRGALREALFDAPFPTTLAAYNPPLLARGRDYDVLLEVDGQPGIVRVRIGRGSVILVLFDFGRVVSLMQQGRPSEGLQVEVPDAGRRPRAADLALAPQMLTARAPWADLIERNVVYLLDAQRPVGRLWLFPSAHRGALVASHSDQGFGDRMLFMTAWEHDNNERASVFTVAGSLSPEALARLHRLGSDAQLLTVPALHPLVPHRDWGIGRFRPIRRERNLAEQRELLSHDARPYPPAIATRSLDGIWTPDWLQHFRVLEAAGVTIDLSYQPHTGGGVGPAPEQMGYLFGSGLPFRAIDTTGERFGVVSLPTVASDAVPGYSVDRLRELIVGSSSGHHTAIVVDWRPDTMALRPSFDALEGWRTSFALARSQELWVTTVPEYADFLRRRGESRVRSTFSSEARRLVIDADLIGPERGTEDVTALTPSIAFPARYDSRVVSSVTVDGVARDIASLELTGDRVLHVLPLAPGAHRIEVHWTPPAEVVPMEGGLPGLPPPGGP